MSAVRSEDRRCRGGAIRSRPTAFKALMLRDLTVLRKNFLEFMVRTMMQPLLFVFVFTYVFPKIGQGVGGAPEKVSSRACSSPASSRSRASSRASRPWPCRSCRSSGTRARSRTA